MMVVISKNVVMAQLCSNKLTKKLIMKTNFILVAIAFIAITSSANAQIQQGNILMGGDLANFNLGLNGPKILDIEISPKAAWFVRDNIALGGYLDFGIKTAKHVNTTTTYSVGALGRYYGGKQDEIVKHSRFFGELTAGFGGADVSHGGSTNGLDISAGPGYAYFITPNIGLEFLVKYDSLIGFGSTPYQGNVNAALGFQIYLDGSSAAKRVKNDMN